jgi:hypothetical protein
VEKSSMFLEVDLYSNVTYSDERDFKGKCFFNENHVVVFVYVFEHLDFEVEGGVKIKLIDQTHMLLLCN